MVDDLFAEWRRYPCDKIEIGFRCLIHVYRMILKTAGNNDFDRHCGDRKLRRRGLDTNYACPGSYVDYAREKQSDIMRRQQMQMPDVVRPLVDASGSDSEDLCHDF